MSQKYKASNQNDAPVHARIDRWCSVVEIMVSFALFVGMLAYIMLPAMLGQHVFSTITTGAGNPGDGDVIVTLEQGTARGLLWTSALSITLTSSVALHFMIWAGSTVLRMPNLRFFVSSVLCVSVASGSLVRAAALRVPLPEGADLPVLFLSGWIDIPGIATSGFLQGLHHSVLAPFTAVGAVGVFLALYRMGKARLDRKIEAYRTKR